MPRTAHRFAFLAAWRRALVTMAGRGALGGPVQTALGSGAGSPYPPVGAEVR